MTGTSVLEVVRGDNKLKLNSLPALMLILLAGLLGWSLYALHNDHQKMQDEMEVTNYLLSCIYW